MEPSIASRPFRTTPAGETVDLYTLTDSSGIEVSVMTYGAAVQQPTGCPRACWPPAACGS